MYIKKQNTPEELFAQPSFNKFDAEADDIAADFKILMCKTSVGVVNKYSFKNKTF
jgi:hypothetical protein